MSQPKNYSLYHRIDQILRNDEAMNWLDLTHSAKDPVVMDLINTSNVDILYIYNKGSICYWNRTDIEKFFQQLQIKVIVSVYVDYDWDDSNRDEYCAIEGLKVICDEKYGNVSCVNIQIPDEWFNEEFVAFLKKAPKIGNLNLLFNPSSYDESWGILCDLVASNPSFHSLTMQGHITLEYCEGFLEVIKTNWTLTKISVKNNVLPLFGIELERILQRNLFYKEDRQALLEADFYYEE